MAERCVRIGMRVTGAGKRMCQALAKRRGVDMTAAIMMAVTEVFFGLDRAPVECERALAGKKSVRRGGVKGPVRLKKGGKA